MQEPGSGQEPEPVQGQEPAPVQGQEPESVQGQEPGSAQGQEPQAGSRQQAAPKELLSPGARSFIMDYWAEAKTILLKPKAFFDSMPTEGGMRDPLVFAIIALGVNGVLGMITTFNILPLVLFPVGLIALAVGSVVANALAQQMGGKGTFEATFRVMAYGTAPWLFGWIPIPILAQVVPALYAWFLNYLGVFKVHGINEAKTLTVVLLPPIVVGVILGFAGCALLVKMFLHI